MVGRIFLKGRSIWQSEWLFLELLGFCPSHKDHKYHRWRRAAEKYKKRSCQTPFGDCGYAPERILERNAQLSGTAFERLRQCLLR